MTEIDRTAAELIESAVEEIDKVGWCQNKLVSKQGQACMIGGLYLVAEARGWALRKVSDFVTCFTWIDWTNSTVLDRAAAAIHNHLRYDVPGFNDKVGRTWEECRDKMMETAKTLRERG